MLPNEEVIFSFSTAKGKKMVLAKDTTEAYIVYRFGTNAKIEFEYPEQKEGSRKKFTYSFYLRGGGEENEGLDLNYVYFVSNGLKYVIYNNYSAADDKPSCGIKVIDETKEKTTVIHGDSKTITGSLLEFRFNNLLETGEELFDWQKYLRWSITFTELSIITNS